MITQAELKERLRYDPDTGIFTWISSPRNGHVGKEAGWTDEKGYVYIRIRKSMYASHRLAWLYMTGQWPTQGCIDHINTVPSDNRWINLRDASKRMNQENRRKAGKNNKAQLLGVSPNGKRWSASIVSCRIKHYIGTFDTPEQAHEAYVAEKRKLHLGCTL